MAIASAPGSRAQSPNAQVQIIVGLYSGQMRNSLLLALVIVLCGCPGTTNLIQSIALAPGQTPALNTQVDLILSGLGSCRDLAVDWGEGSPLDHSTFVTLQGHHLTHTYTGWPGGKTVTVQAVTGCEGTARTRFKIEPSLQQIGWNRDPQGSIKTCYVVENLITSLPDLAPNSLVHITSPATPVVNFGCPFNGCIYGPDGKPGSSASSAFQFPDFANTRWSYEWPANYFRAVSRPSSRLPSEAPSRSARTTTIRTPTSQVAGLSVLKSISWGNSSKTNPLPCGHSSQYGMLAGVPKC